MPNGIPFTSGEVMRSLRNRALGPPQAMTRIGREEIRFGEPGGGRVGSFDPIRRILIKKGMSPENAARTASHEDVHAVLRGIDLDKIDPKSLKAFSAFAHDDAQGFVEKAFRSLLPNRGTEEIIAEVIATAEPANRKNLINTIAPGLEPEVVDKLRRIAGVR